LHLGLLQRSCSLQPELFDAGKGTQEPLIQSNPAVWRVNYATDKSATELPCFLTDSLDAVFAFQQTIHTSLLSRNPTCIVLLLRHSCYTEAPLSEPHLSAESSARNRYAQAPAVDPLFSSQPDSCLHVLRCGLFRKQKALYARGMPRAVAVRKMDVKRVAEPCTTMSLPLGQVHGRQTFTAAHTARRRECQRRLGSMAVGLYAGSGGSEDIHLLSLFPRFYLALFSISIGSLQPFSLRCCCVSWNFTLPTIH
jgi:hypothetical protein